MTPDLISQSLVCSRMNISGAGSHFSQDLFSASEILQVVTALHLGEGSAGSPVHDDKETPASAVPFPPAAPRSSQQAPSASAHSVASPQWLFLASGKDSNPWHGPEAPHNHGAHIIRAVEASKQFNNEVLKAHNEYRQQHGVPPLKLCKKLNQEAQQYSEALASTRILKHSPESSRGQCGENLAWASYDQTGKEVADRWYSEIKNYNFQQPGFTSGTGHFTAMVWKNTKKMGVGKASASDGSSFVVARYFPAGNVVNQGFFEENVLPPKK
ncbi:Golgi-associated plant pathogenesis-related protein 1 [Ctenodactylus gundi]